MKAVIALPETMPRSRATGSETDPIYKPDLPADHPDRMNLNMTVGDRRQLELVAKKEKVSPTKWILDRIWGGADVKPGHGQKVTTVLTNEVQAARLEEIAVELGFVNAGQMLQMVALRIARSPETAEAILFGEESQPVTLRERTVARMAARKAAKEEAA